jgi:hypothetical protein
MMVVLVAVAVGFFAPLIFFGKSFSFVAEYQSGVYPWRAHPPSPFQWEHPHSDQAELSFPWEVSARSALWEGSFPLWEPGVFGGGYDLFSNGSAGLAYPPRLLALVLFDDAAHIHDFFSVFHLLLAGLAACGLGRALGLGRLPATFFGATWMLSTWTTGWLQLEVIAPLPAFLPLGLLVVHLAFTRRSLGWTAVAGLCGGLTLVSGHLLLMGVVYLTFMLYAAALVVAGMARAVRAGSQREAAREALRGLTTVALSVGSAAIVLVPTRLALRSTQRVPFDYAELQSLWLSTPDMFWSLLTPPKLPIEVEALQYLGFVGSATALFAVLGVVAGRGPGAWLARGLVAVSALVALGTPLTWLFYHLVPGFNVLRPYSRLMFVTGFGWALAGAVGLERLLGLVGPSPRRSLGLATRGVVALALVATVLQLGFYGRQMNPQFVAHRAAAFGKTPVIDEALRAQATGAQWPGRVLPVVLDTVTGDERRFTLNGNTGLAVGLDSFGGYDSTLDRRAVALLRVVTGDDARSAATVGLPSAYLPVFASSQTRFDLARRLGMTSVLTPPSASPSATKWSSSWVWLDATHSYSGPDGDLYMVRAPLTGPRLVAGTEVVADEVEALERFAAADFPAERSVVVERGELERTGLSPGVAVPGQSGVVSQASRERNALTVQVSCTSEAWLLVPDAWAPGWSATVNGLAAPVLRVNYNQRAVRVGPGSSTLRMTYRSPGLVPGALVSTLSLLVAAAMLGQAWRRRRAGAGPREPSPV